MTDMIGTSGVKALFGGVALALPLASILGCSKTGGEHEVLATEQVTTEALVVAKAIGDPCDRSDGWTPQPVQSQPVVADVPVANPVPADYVDYPQLGPGIGYCLSHSPGYPYGYYTMNCASDGDCPEPSRCDDTLCRAPCDRGMSLCLLI